MQVAPPGFKWGDLADEPIYGRKRATPEFAKLNFVPAAPTRARSRGRGAAAAGRGRAPSRGRGRGAAAAGRGRSRGSSKGSSRSSRSTRSRERAARKSPSPPDRRKLLADPKYRAKESAAAAAAAAAAGKNVADSILDEVLAEKKVPDDKHAAVRKQFKTVLDGMTNADKADKATLLARARRAVTVAMKPAKEAKGGGRRRTKRRSTKRRGTRKH
jgi:hypothetical protein